MTNADPNPTTATGQGYASAAPVYLANGLPAGWTGEQVAEHYEADVTEGFALALPRTVSLEETAVDGWDAVTCIIGPVIPDVITPPPPEPSLFDEVPS